METNLQNNNYSELHTQLVKIIYDAVKEDNSSLGGEIIRIKSVNKPSISDVIKFDKNFINEYINLYEKDVNRFNNSINQNNGDNTEKEMYRLGNIKKSLDDMINVLEPESSEIADYVKSKIKNIKLFYQKP